MPTLHVQNVPNGLFLEIQRLAKTQNLSLDAQVIVLLTRALQLEKMRGRKAQLKVLSSIRQRRFIPPKNVPLSLVLLEEDRNQ